jgi:hypothetical protein
LSSVTDVRSANARMTRLFTEVFRQGIPDLPKLAPHAATSAGSRQTGREASIIPVADPAKVLMQRGLERLSRVGLGIRSGPPIDRNCSLHLSTAWTKMDSLG